MQVFDDGQNSQELHGLDRERGLSGQHRREAWAGLTATMHLFVLRNLEGKVETE